MARKMPNLSSASRENNQVYNRLVKIRGLASLSLLFLFSFGSNFILLLLFFLDRKSVV